jgi:WD40 repeat protein
VAEPAFLSARCPQCGAASDRVPAHLAGRTVRCPRCEARFPIPAAAGGPPPATPPAEPPPAPTVAEDAVAAPTVAEAGAVAPTVAETGARPPTPAAEAPRAKAPQAGWQPGDTVLGLYEVLGVLGQGGMGRVYRVRHRGWDLDLAVKVPLPEVLEAAGGADLFEREAETWVSLGLHPHVVTCHYVRRVDGLPLVFAELVDGGSLHEAIRQRRLGSAEAILDVAIQFAWGLHHAHEEGLVHRDVKPANVLLASDGLAKVTDFGLARARSARPAPAAPAAGGSGHTLTVEGGGGGTPAYVSPEQAKGLALSRRSDLWGFGLSVLEAFLGGRTWEYGLAAAEVLEGYRRGGHAGADRPAMPEAVALLLAACFRERPEDRPHDLAEVGQTLRAAYEGLAGRAYPRRPPKGGRGSADALNNRAVSLVDLGRHAEAAATWGRALAAEAQHVEATYNAGLAAWSAGQLPDPELLRRLEEACASHPGRARAQHLLGRVHLALGQPSEAATAFERTTALGGALDADLDRDVAAARRGVPPPLRTLRGLPGPVAALSLSSDGRTVAAGSGGEVRLWDAGTGRHLRTIAVPDGPLHALALLPDGRFLLVGAEHAPLTLWDVATGQPVRAWARHTGYATCLAAARAGRFVASGGSDRVVRLWDSLTGHVVHEMAGHEDAVSAVACGEGHVVSASRDGTARLWTIEDGRCLATLRGHEGRVLAVALDEAQARVVSGGEDGSVRDWGLRSHEVVHAWRSHGRGVAAVTLSPDGSTVLSGSSDRTVRAFDGRRLHSLVRLDGGVLALAIGPDGTAWAAHGTAVSALPAGRVHLPPAALCRPASASEEEARASSFEVQIQEARGSLSAGDLVTAVSLARRAREVPGHERSQAALAVWDDLLARLPRRALRSAWEEGRLEGADVQALAVDGTGARALTAGLDTTLRLWDLASRQVEATLTGHAGAVAAVSFAGAGRAVSAGRDRTVRLWDLAGRRPAALLEGHADTVAAVDATPDGARAASGSWDGTIRVWDLRRRAVLRVLEGHEAHVAAVRLAPDGQVVASGGWDGAARLWDVESGKALGVFPGDEGNVTAVALHADGRRVATGGESGTVRLWEARTRQVEQVLGGHTGEITGLAFTPDGRFLLSGSRDRTVRVWDLRRGEAVRTLPHPALVLGLALTPVASVLATAGADCVRLWHLDWEPEPSAPAVSATALPSPAAPASVALLGRTPRDPGRAAATATPPPAPASTFREELRRAAPRAVPSVPLPRKVPWRRLAVAGAVVGALALAWLTWRRSDKAVRLSPYMAQAVPREVRLVDIAAYRASCVPADYERHLDALRSGNPEGEDVACVAAQDTPGVVADVLDGAPLTSPEALVALRLRNSAAAALSGLTGPAVPALCERLDDPRAEARLVVATALGVMEDPGGVDCVRATVASGTPTAQGAVALALRQQATRGRLHPAEAWSLVESLLAGPEPEARIAGLRAASVFAVEVAAPAVRALLEDPDPEVAAAAREAVTTVDGVRRTDQLRGDTGP